MNYIIPISSDVYNRLIKLHDELAGTPDVSKCAGSVGGAGGGGILASNMVETEQSLLQLCEFEAKSLHGRLDAISVALRMIERVLR